MAQRRTRVSSRYSGPQTEVSSCVTAEDAARHPRQFHQDLKLGARQRHDPIADRDPARAQFKAQIARDQFGGFVLRQLVRGCGAARP